MWNAFGKGPGVYQGGGYVGKAQGWEFVSRYRGERDKEKGQEKSHSPHRYMSSSSSSVPAAAAYEEPKEGAALRAHGNKCELHSQHLKLKRKVEDLKKRHGQEKEAWVKEKEALLREVAQIQAGENRRILLDLRSVLAVVQTELRKEEQRRSDLQLQYSNDKCAWELEKAELKCRIAQLESKANKQHTDKAALDLKDTFRREREEQKRLLADTHTAAMDLRKQLENNERNWNKEKLELLERFDNERKEWESQLKEMQNMIEELYQEVKTRRENSLNGQEQSVSTEVLRLSLHSPSSDSSELSEKVELSYHPDAKANPTQMETIPFDEPEQEINTSSAKKKNRPLFVDDLVTEKLEEASKSPNRKPTGNEKKKCTSALNAALREIAKVSEELCSYQEEIRKKPNHRRMKSCSFLEGLKENQNEVKTPETVIGFNSDTQAFNTAFDSFNDTEEIHNWKNGMCISSNSKELSRDSPSDADTTDKAPLRKKEAPPVPPRSTSWYLTSSFPAFSQTSETLLKDIRFQSQGDISGENCNSPPIGKNSEASVHENNDVELLNTLVTPVENDVDFKCTKSSSHSRWSGDVSENGIGFHNKSSAFSPVQKSFSNANTLSSERYHSHVYSCGLEYLNSLLPPTASHTNVLSPSTITGHSVHSPTVVAHTETDKVPRNEILEAKTEEFNRILFQTDKHKTAPCADAGFQSSAHDDKQNGSKSECSLYITESDNVLGQFSSHRSSSAFSEYIPANSQNNTRPTGQGKPINGFVVNNSYHHMLDEYNWRPGSFSGRPRSSDSRSNFGVVEKILKSYEKAADRSVQKSNCGATQPIKCDTDALFQCLNLLKIEKETQVIQKQLGVPVVQQTMHDKARHNVPEVCGFVSEFGKPANFFSWEKVFSSSQTSKPSLTVSMGS
ncbi:uncharacterized protein KIAA0408 isoform X2 [Latimeria chalumnae]|uniref:uncharacterized protein KIAA0408 isoform X2 n=1 Tax=Latimeria chalumnae TaxID=7897 RepID=UPI0003C199E2|nr:PREDICTED: uncharacterized protein KIAA0408 homolog isoform X2 [Latimeria chalumnae]|eukprot:XP_006006803.1 PREDICTED: uncharacterized protein KIAA0408 homolog isoform X2 [Latimeria chalumnae]